MIFETTPIDGACRVCIEPHVDTRGFFARTWCSDEFGAHGLDNRVVQASLSHNRRAGTLRGMHFSRPPSREAKLVRCVRGAIFDAIFDLRPASPSFLKSYALRLDARDHASLFIPPGVAHGFQTLEDDSDVLYMMSEAYRPELAGGLRHDDPLLGIRWPLPVSEIAERDRSYADLSVPQHRERWAAAGH